MAQVDGAAGVLAEHPDQPIRLAGDLVDDGAEVCFPFATSSSLISHTAVVPGSTSAGATPRSSSNSCKPAGVGTTSLPSAVSRFWRLRRYYLVSTAAQSAGLQNVHPHTLRHSCGYHLADKGTDLRTMQDYLGHRDPRHTVHYSRITGRQFEGLWK